ncbi:reverse transcriptase domain-containing protein [Tanacetum coccineum]
MPAWCHMFNSTLIGAARVWFDELPPESIDSYKDLKAAFLAYFMQQKKHVKDPVEIHNIKQKDGETIEEFMERFKVKTGRMKGAPECIKISGFMHGVNNPELTKRLNEHVPKTLEEMMTTTTAFIQGETAAASKKKVHTPWKPHDQSKRHNSERRSDFRNQPRDGQGLSKFTPLNRTPKEIFVAESEKFKPPPPMVTPADKRSSNKFCEFHNDKGHSTDECMQLKKQIKELVKTGKLSHFIKEIRQDRDKQKNRKKEAPAKEKVAAIYMIQPWHRVTRQKVTLSFAQVNEITFPPLSANKGTEGIGNPSIEYDHLSGETIWPLGQLRLLVTIGDAEHFTKAWMNFMIVRSPSPYNGIIGRPGIREIQAVPSTAHGMLKFPVDGGVVTIRSTILTPNECATITATSKDSMKKIEGGQENLKVAIHHDFPDQEVALGGTLSIEGRTALCALLKRNLDIFAWQPSDMTGVPRQIAEHRLNIREGYPPVRQKKRGQAPERAKAIQAKVGWNLEVYIDDLVIKSHTEAELLRDIEETFRTHKTVPREDRSCVATSIPTDNQGGLKPQREVSWPKQAAYGASLDDRKDFNPYASLFCESGFASAELNYTPMEKLVLALVFAAKRLRRYFQAHPIAVITDQPIRQVMSRPERKSQRTCQKRRPRKNHGRYSWMARHVLIGSGVSLILTSPEGAEFTYALRFQFTASNNEAEYEALLVGLRIATQMGVRNIRVPRSHNKKADALSKIASTSFAHLSKQVLVEVLQEKSIQEREVAAVVEEEGPTWITPITEYLKDGVLPDDKKEANKLRIKARQYELMDGILYRRSFLRPWLRCVGPLQADYVIREIHEGSCSMHAGPRSVVAKAMRSGYYWPTMHRDARDMILKCKDCQVHRPVPRNPQQPLTPITSPWPFYKWGIDIAGPFPEGPGKVKFLIVAMDYFTKWIEAKAVATISGGQVKKFVWDNIVCRFGLPGEIVSDNGKQFSDNPFKDWCEKLNITQRFASVKHPQSNGLVERANRSLGEGIKARLGEGNKNWIEEIPHVLWAHRTMIKSSNGDTPFFLTYDTKAVIPAEIGMPTYRTATVDIVRNDDEIRLNLDLVEERREQAAIREAKAKSKMMRYYNARVRGDYVYRSNKASHAMDGGKLGPKWEGPYEVTEVLGGGAYKLRSMDGAVLPRTWNIANLKKCYL